jgi:hypothetical protein
MHPDLGEEVFREWYGSAEMLTVSAALMGCGVGDMQFGEYASLLLHKDKTALTSSSLCNCQLWLM